MTEKRRAQLIAIRNRLNTMGNEFSANRYGCTVLDRSDAWNNRRICLRNRINRRLAKEV